MEQSHLPLPKNGEGVHGLKHIDPANDLGLLDTITLNPTHINDTWLSNLDQLIDRGSTRLNPLYSSTKTVREVAKAREAVINTFGLDNEAHPLHKAYDTVRRGRPLGVLSDHLYQVMKTLYEISDGNLVSMAQDSPYLLTGHNTSLLRRFNNLKRIALLLEWRGDVRQLIVEFPHVLTYSESKVDVLVRLAISHAGSNSHDADGQVTRLINRSR